MNRLTLMVLWLSLAGPALADDYRALFDEAAESIEWNIEESWAFTETHINDDEARVARFDPRKPEDERWSLVSIDGREPTTAEIREFRSDKNESDTSDTSNRLDIVGADTLELIEETDTRWHFRFIPNEDEIDFMDNVDATVTIRKDGPWVEVVDLRNHYDIQPGFGTKIATFLVSLEFGPAVLNGPIVPKTMKVKVSGRALLFIGFSETEHIEYGDFVYVGEEI